MLGCLRLQDITGFEVVVVTNTPGIFQDYTPFEHLKIIAFEQANIAKARNLGIAATQGDFVAFCDDDALPDPGWLRQITAPFADLKIGGTGGFTRGRNGISMQWGAVITDVLAQENRIELTKTTVFKPNDKTCPVMIGTNCAFRKSALLQINGFDENFAYYLDDSDISLRLSQAGWQLAILPECQVHHSFAPSAIRHKNRAPKTLEPLGKSKAYYCRKHGKPADIDMALQHFRDGQFKRLEQHFLRGELSSAQMFDLKKTLGSGFGKGKELPLAGSIKHPMPDGLATPESSPSTAAHIVLAGRANTAKLLDEKAQGLVNQGFRVSVVYLEFSPKYMQVTFSDLGFWQHHGGQFGKINRNESLWKWRRFRPKVFDECHRISKTRPIDYLAFLEPGRFDASLLPQTFGMSSLNGYKVLDDSLFWRQKENIK